MGSLSATTTQLVTNNDTPAVTVAVATRNRSSGLRALLAALEAQTLSSFEVVVVDDASTDDTPRLLEDAAGRSSFDLRYLRNPTHLGPSVGRNMAWQSARGAVVAFTDDDCAPTPLWLEEGLSALGGRGAVIVGATEPNPEQAHLLDPLARTMQVRNAKIAPTCNVFYLRSDLEAVDGFDEQFGTLGGEDTDLAWRVHRSLGRELAFAPRALVHHDVRKRSLSQAAKETYRWAGVARVAARHTDLARSTWHRGYFFRKSHPRALLAALGLIATPVLPVSALLVLPWLRLRVLQGRPNGSWITNLRFAPALFAIELLEIGVLARASIRYRTLIL